MYMRGITACHNGGPPENVGACNKESWHRVPSGSFSDDFLLNHIFHLFATGGICIIIGKTDFGGNPYAYNLEPEPGGVP
jgi:hypothetical protein